MRSAHAGDPVLGNNWVPILASGSCDLYAAVWRPDAEAVVAGVPLGEPTEIEFSSVEQMVHLFNRCFEDGAYSVDSQGMFSMSPDRYDEVYERVVGQ